MTQSFIDLGQGVSIPILYEDRSVLALDKPAGWMLAPDSWDRTGRNLQLALIGSIARGDHWARSRRLRFIRYVHRLDAPTTGILLTVKSPGAVSAYSDLFQGNAVEKIYLAVVDGSARRGDWHCATPLARDPSRPGVMIGSARHGQPAETHFKTVFAQDGYSLVEARPVTGRTHQIRVHLALSGHPVVGDDIDVYKRQLLPSSQRCLTRTTRARLSSPRFLTITAPRL